MRSARPARPTRDGAGDGVAALQRSHVARLLKDGEAHQVRAASPRSGAHGREASAGPSRRRSRSSAPSAEAARRAARARTERDPDVGAHVGAGTRSASARRTRPGRASRWDRRRCSGCAGAERGREAGQRRPVAEEAVHRDGPVDRLRDAGHRHQQLLGDQITDAGIDQRGGAHPPLHLVVLGPRGDRHRPEGMPDDDARAAPAPRPRPAPPRDPRRSGRSSSHRLRRARCRRAHEGHRRRPASPAPTGRGSGRSSTGGSRSSRGRGPRGAPSSGPNASACSTVPSASVIDSGPPCGGSARTARSGSSAI